MEGCLSKSHRFVARLRGTEVRMSMTIVYTSVSPRRCTPSPGPMYSDFPSWKTIMSHEGTAGHGIVERADEWKW